MDKKLIFWACLAQPAGGIYTMPDDASSDPIPKPTNATPVPSPAISIPPLIQFFLANLAFNAPTTKEEMILITIATTIAVTEEIRPALTTK